MIALSRSANDALEREFSALAITSRKDLIDRWTIAYGRPPPKGISQRLLERAAAYEMQVTVYGGLKPRLRRKLLLSVNRDTPEKPPKPGWNLTPGTRLVREWNGLSHTVEVVDGGFAWNSKVHKSLSAVARAITGARWSGPRFFGL